MAKNISSSIKINGLNKISKINPFIYGSFIEFIRDCINNGMWAELIQNRGFEYDDANNDGVSDPWYPVGINDIYLYYMDESEKYNSKYSQKIEVINHNNGFRGIAQKDIKIFNKEKYKGYVWVKSNNRDIALEVNIKSRSNTSYFKKRFENIESKWTKYEFSFSSGVYDDDVIFEIDIYGGGSVWLDQVSLMPESAVDGIWKEVASATSELEIGILRYPGGCYADMYNWLDGIGPIDKRPIIKNKIWGGYEENSFGTDEFIKFCRNTNAEPMICVNFGSGTPDEAANWIEYCNGGTDTKYGAMRASNGNPEPHNVKYWDVGNETFAEWEIGNCSASEFSKKYVKFYKAMKEKDDSIIILTCGGDGNDPSQDWNRTLLKETKGQFDYITLHFYTPQIGKTQDEKQKVFYGPKKLDNETIYYGTVGSAYKYNEIINNTNQSIKKLAPDNEIKIAVPEWNVMYWPAQTYFMGVEEINNNIYREQTLEAAIFNAGMLNIFLKNSAVVKICNFSDLVNGWHGGSIRNDRSMVYKTPSYYAIKLYSNSGAKNLIDATISCGETYEIKDVGHVKNVKDIPYVDIVACTGDSEIIIFIINRHLQRSASVDISIDGIKLKGTILVSEITSMNSFDANTPDKESIKIRDSIIEDVKFKDGFTMSPCSIVRLKLPLA